MIHFPKTASLVLTTGLMLVLPAHAQESAQTEQQQSSQSSQCREQLNQMAQRMNDDGYWLAGYPGAAVDGYGTRYPYGTMGGTAPDTVTSPGTEPAPAGQTAAPADQPWAGVNWEQRPHYEIGMLFRAANILASGGDEEACMTVASAIEERYGEFTSQLSELGVEPGEIQSWRQAEIATAVPVSETGFPRRIEDIVGSDVRNPQDEDLGEVEDVVLDAQSGEIRYVIVSTGGFFGIGGDDVAVPWEHLHVTPGMGTFVLPVQQAAMEQAPRAGADDLIDPQQTGSTDANEIDTYWEDAIGAQTE